MKVILCSICTVANTRPPNPTPAILLQHVVTVLVGTPPRSGESLGEYWPRWLKNPATLTRSSGPRPSGDSALFRRANNSRACRGYPRQSYRNLPSWALSGRTSIISQGSDRASSAQTWELISNDLCFQNACGPASTSAYQPIRGF